MRDLGQAPAFYEAWQVQASADSLVAGQGPVELWVEGGQGRLVVASWDGKNDQSRAVDGGYYYLKIDTMDSFGKVTSQSFGAQVLPAAQGHRLVVYNSAGEIVVELDVEGLPEAGEMRVDDPLLTSSMDAQGQQQNPLQIILVDAQQQEHSLTWDGKNSQGRAVSSGRYLLQYRSPASPGYPSTTLSASITVLAAATPAEEIMVAPNPVQAGEGRTFLFYQADPWARALEVKIHDVSGRLVAGYPLINNTGPAEIDLGSLARGVYIVTVQWNYARGAVAKSTKVAVK